MASSFETSIRKGLEKLHLAGRVIDDLIAPQPVPFPQARNVLVAYPGFIDWLVDFDDHTGQQLTQDRHILWHALERYRRMKRVYERRVLDELHAVLRRWTGKAILREIHAASRRTVSIRPYLADDDDDYNASAGMRDEEAATAAGMPILNTRGRATGGSGSGRGSNVDIDFSPEIWGVFSESPTQRPSEFASPSKPTGPGAQADEVLFHELVHACRMMRGLHYRADVNQQYDNEEEYLAVVITNIYLAEKGQTHLRDSHKGHNYLARPEKFLDNPQHVNMSPRRLLERLRLSQSSLFGSLADIGPKMAWFNPVRDYRDERKQGKGKSP
jgi:hypothetical protein